MTTDVTGAIDSYDLKSLSAQLLEMGFKLAYFLEVDSTMNLIQKEAANKSGERVVVLVDHQTQGVGREERSWQDKPNCSLMFSVLCQIPQESVAIFADMVTLAIIEALRKESACEVKVKYPNDLVIDDKKLGGILVKNIYDDKLKYLGTNLGVGLNIHYTQADLDGFKTDYPAVSLDLCTGVFIKRQNLLVEILRILQFLSTEIEVISKNPGAIESFDKKWRLVSSVLGRKIVILKNDKIIDQGKVVNTGIGRGIEMETDLGNKWFSLFDSDMKVRIIK